MNSNYLGNVMKYFILKNNDDFINQSFNLPDPKLVKIKCKNTDKSQYNSIFGSNLIKKFEDLTIL